MDKKKNMKIHPVAEMFPMLSDDDYKSLLEDIKQRGQLIPIIIKDDVLLDGRNRLKACEELGVKPWFQEWGGEGGTQAEFILSLNRIRRHLTEDQQIITTAKASQWIRKEAEERQKATQFQEGNEGGPGRGKTVTQDSESPLINKPDKNKQSTAGKIAEIANTTRYKAEKAIELVNKYPDLAKAVEQGSMTIKQASTETRRRNKTYKTKEDKSEPNQKSKTTGRTRRVSPELKKLIEELGPEVKTWKRFISTWGKLPEICKQKFINEYLPKATNSNNI